MPWFLMFVAICIQKWLKILVGFDPCHYWVGFDGTLLQNSSGNSDLSSITAPRPGDGLGDRAER